MFSWPRVRLVSFVLLRQKLRVVLQLSTPQLPVIVIVVATVDGLGAVHGGVELLSALTGGSPGGADPLHGGEDPPDPAEQVEAGEDRDTEEEEEGSPHHPPLAVLVLLVEAELAAQEARAGGRQVPPLDVREAGEGQQEGDQPAEGQQQGGAGPRVLREQQLAVPDQIPSEERQQTQMGGKVLSMVLMMSEVLLMRVITEMTGRM